MREITYAQAINETLRYHLKNNELVFIMGENIGKYGGVFQVTSGLIQDFGPKRVIETPISEAAFLGSGIGAALTGLRPIVEIMFIDFTPSCMDMIVNQMAKMHYMLGGKAKIPMVLRTNCGSTARGAAAQHSQSFYAFFLHIPGLRVVTPSTPYDAKGLLNSAIADDNPVIFVEHKRLYNTKGNVPEEYYTVPFGKADIKKEGNDITIVATQALVRNALNIAEEMEREGISIEVVDPMTLNPLDKESIFKSVKKTGRLIVADEGCLTCGIASEISSLVVQEVFDYLQSPIIKVGSPDTPVPYSSVLEKIYIPGETNIRAAVQKIREYI